MICRIQMKNMRASQELVQTTKSARIRHQKKSETIDLLEYYEYKNAMQMHKITSWR